MEDIKVGEYVRLARNQGINKIVDITEDGLYELDRMIADEWGDETYIIGDEDILKYSTNLIDLIEVGDYVNGKKIDDAFEIEVAPITKNKIIIFKHDIDRKNAIFDFEIETVATKEQFKSIEYEV